MTNLWNDENAIDEAIGTHIRGRLLLGIPVFVFGAGVTGIGTVIPSPLSPWLIGAGVSIMTAAVGGSVASAARENALDRRANELKAG